MKIASPDAALIDLFDRALSLPQGRGRPLPEILIPFGLLPPMAAILVASSLPAMGQALFIPAWIVVCLVFGNAARVERLRLRADAAAWDAKRAMGYRAMALGHREGQAVLRSVGLSAAAMGAVATAFSVTRLGPLAPQSLNLGAYLLTMAAFLCVLYARCAMPRDPDLRGRVGVPQAA